MESIQSFQLEEHSPLIGLMSIGCTAGFSVEDVPQRLRSVCRTIAIDTDAVAIGLAGADKTILIANPPNPLQGFELANTQKDAVETAISDFHAVFILAEMDSAVAKMLAPLMASVVSRKRIPALGIAITPADHHSALRDSNVRSAVAKFRQAGATVFPLQSHCREGSPENDDNRFDQNVKNLLSTICDSFYLNEPTALDMADLQSVLKPRSLAAIGCGTAEGPDRAKKAAELAVAYPMMGADRLRTATGLLIHIRADKSNLKLWECRTVIQTVMNSQPLDSDCFNRFTSSYEPLGEKVIVSILASLPDNHP